MVFLILELLFVIQILLVAQILLGFILGWGRVEDMLSKKLKTERAA